MPTRRFEGSTLDEAVQAARGQVGPVGKIVGASRVRRGGMAGFFAKEHIEIEVELDDGGVPSGQQVPSGQPVASGQPVPSGQQVPSGPGRASSLSGGAHGLSSRRSSRKIAASPRAGKGGLSADGDMPRGDPMSELIEEMAQNGPSSVLDLAEKVNAEQGHFALASDEPGGDSVTRAPRDTKGRGFAHASGVPGANPLPRLGAPTLPSATSRARGATGASAVGQQAAPTAQPPRAQGGTDLRDTLAVELRKAAGTAVGRTGGPRPQQGGSPLRDAIGGMGPVTAPVWGRPTADFADVLERIAKQAGLLDEAGHARDLGPGQPRPGSGSGGAAAPRALDSEIWATPGETATPSQVAPPAPVHHAGAILSELDEKLGRQGQQPTATAPVVATEHRADAAPNQASAPRIAAATALGQFSPPGVLPALPPVPEISALGSALQGLGLPLPACQAVLPAATRDDLEAELRHALSRALPPLPPVPTSAASVVAVVGPREQVMATAKLVAAQIGAPADEIALATPRKVWRQADQVLLSPEAAAESRRGWRWRGHPSVVAIETPVRPAVTNWTNAMLRALEPTMCWGVAEASRKPEDLMAWSQALGGLDVLALVDLDGTTTPAAALAAAIPVGQLDGQPATAGTWAQLLCSRLIG